MAEDDSGWSTAELSARATLTRLGFRVDDDPAGGGVLIGGPGYTLRAATALALLRDLAPHESRR